MKILVYDDNPDFGGHQIMACRGVDALAAATVEIAWMIDPANRRLAERIAGCETLAASPDLGGWNPDLVLCIQGDLHQSAKGILAARTAGIPCISYLALPHSMGTMGARLGTLRDRRFRKTLNLPDRYIVISQGMGHLLAGRGCTRPITVVPNGIPGPPATRRPRAARECTLGILGRLEFRQKRQDLLVRAFLGHPEAFGDCRLLIAGDGPDADRLHRMVEHRGRIEWRPWQNDPEAFYDAIDLLALPSRYEGVPLVMLEALARGIPVIASAVDGMKELLPAGWTFEGGSAAALARTFSRVRTAGYPELARLREQVLAENNLETFRARFSSAVLGA